MKKWFANQSLGRKIVYPLLAVSLVTGIITYFYFSDLYQESETNALVTKARAVILSAEAAREQVAEQRQYQVFRTDMKDVQQMLRTVPIFTAMRVAGKKSQELGFTLKVPKESPRNLKNEPDAREKEILAKFSRGEMQETWEIDKAANEVRFFRPVRLTRECLDCHGDPANSVALWGNSQGKDPTGGTMEGWKEGEVHGAFEVKMSLEPVDAAVRSKSFVIAGIAGLGMALTVLIALLVSRVVGGPVKTLADEANMIARGDLSVEVPDLGNDEVGHLAQSFRTMVTNLRDTIGQVTEASAAVASACNQISSSTEEMAAGAQEQTSQATEVAGAVEEMTKTIIENSRNASNTVETAKHAKVAAEQGGEVVEETVVGMKRIAEVVQQSAGTVQELGKSSDQIGEIITVIDDIADQTNLLALNAAIEAARAGEQGRGFAVVADEVRKLAERTTKATKEIAGMIKRIQTDTQGAVSAMEEGTKQVSTGIALADKAGASLHEIVNVSQKVTDMVTQIAAASEQQSKASEQISRNVEGISNVTNESAMGVQQIAQAAEDLNRLTENLQTLVGRFKLGSTKHKIGTIARARVGVRADGELVPHETAV
jgi:methyl-accepting chemotaxis protein